MKTALFAALTMALLATSDGLAVEPIWSATYDGAAHGDDGAWGLGQDGEGNIYISGLTATSDNRDFLFIKYTKHGIPVWTNFFDTTNGGDAPFILDASGNVIATFRSDFETDKYTVLKISSAGVPQWTNFFRISTFAMPSAVAADGDGNVFITGFDNGCHTLKYSGAGIPLWTNSILNGSAAGRRIGVDDHGDVIVTGPIQSTSSGEDIFIVKYSSNGSPLWTNYFTGPANGWDHVMNMALDVDGNAILCGRTLTAPDISEFLTLKYSAEGIPMWTNRYRGTNPTDWDVAINVAIDEQGNSVIAGQADSRTVIIKYSESGIPLWTNFLALDGYSIALDETGNVFATFYFGGTIIAYNPSGQPSWTNSNLPYHSFTTMVDQHGDLITTGQVLTPSGKTDILTMKHWGMQPGPLMMKPLTNSIVLSWENPTFHLQSAAAANGPFTKLSGATSPYTNITSDSALFFRLQN